MAIAVPAGRQRYAALDAPSLCAAFQLTAAANAGRPALRTAGADDALTWADYAERVEAVASGLAALGVGPGDAVGLMLANRTEFHLADTAALHLGAIPFSIYNTNPAEKIVPLLENSGARVVVTEPAHVDRVLAAGAGRLASVVMLGEDAGPATLTFAELEALEAPSGFDFEAAWRAVGADDLATIVYTSGTTGEPKGVEWTHGSLLFHCAGMHALAPVSRDGRVVSHLPMAHIAERYISHYASLTFGYTITSCPMPQDLFAALREVRPTRLFGVPRNYEKLAPVIRAIAAADPVQAAALEAGIARYAGRDQPVDFAAAGATPEARALAPVREQLGLDAIEWLTSGGAATPRHVLDLMAGLGLPIVELWGMSETLLALANDPRAIRIGTVGAPVPGIEARLADDGELLVRGPMFARYRQDPERTAEALVDGWLHSGDIVTVDADGYHRVVDRKKELIINSAGKNLAPTLIESAVKQQSPVIGQAVAIGDGRPCVTALLALDPEGLQEFAARRRLAGPHAELARDAAVRDEVARAIEAANATLSRAEQIKAHAIVAAVWAPGGEELTPTSKLRRRVIATKYAEDIERLYA